MNYTSTEKITNYLNTKYLGTLGRSVDGLLLSWGNFIENINNSPDIDNYLNDLSVRRALDEVEGFLLPDEVERFVLDLNNLDNKFVSKTVELNESLWKEDRWYYRRIPEHLKRDLEA